MKVLIGCEESQTVCQAFRNKGHEAYSCDLIDSSGNRPEWHFKMDVFEAIEKDNWDIIIIHPPCTAVCCSGNRHYSKGNPKYEQRLESIRFIRNLWDFSIKKCDKVAMENPRGVLNSSIIHLPNPQYIQPFHFGDPEIKTTGLWLFGLPNLISTCYIEPNYVMYNSKKTKSGKSKYGRRVGTNPSTNNPDNAKLRSRTYPGIAKAMAEQWG